MQCGVEDLVVAICLVKVRQLGNIRAEGAQLDANSEC